MAIKPVKNETDLLALVSKGDQRAFTKLFDAYYKQLGTYVYKLTESLEITEEIVQDVFIKIWLKKEILSELDNFSSYLFILSKNRTLNYLRETAKNKSLHVDWLKQFEDEVIDIDNYAVIEEYRVLIDLAVEKLPPQQKKVYKLSREGRLKYEEIAVILNITPKTVKKHAQLALRCIKNELSSQNDAIIVLVLTAPMIFL